MAIRARLSAPKVERSEWAFHQVKAHSLPASMMFGADRRMEAGTYLAAGFATRQAIAAKLEGWVALHEIANVSQPNRLKGILVDSDYGVPFLAATQVFDIEPTPRKWLSRNKTPNIQSFYVEQGTILLTRSGTVGRSIVSQKKHENVIISDDLLRIRLTNPNDKGWLFAYLRSPSVMAMLQSAHYGHVIKHLEVSHVNALPVVTISDELKSKFCEDVASIVDMREEADRLVASFRKMLSDRFHLDQIEVKGVHHSTASLSALAGRRRRFEASYHSYRAQSLVQALALNSVKMDRLGDVTERVWWMTRFSRNFGDTGVPYMSSDDLFSLSQPETKKIFTDPIPNYSDFFVKQGWLLMACSGQTYGLNGSVTLATKHDESFFFTHDLIRISPNSDRIRSGYLYAFLSHPDIGQLLAKRAAYGSSIPHIDPTDVEEIPLARLPHDIENNIADMAERASQLRADAAELERETVSRAEAIINAFLSR